MVYLGGWHPVCALESLITNGRQLHVGSLLGDFDALELSIVEVVRIVDISDFCRIHGVLELSMVFLCESSFLFSSVLFFSRLNHTCFKIRIDGFS